MAPKGKVVKVRTEHKGYGKIHGFPCANGMFGCNHAGSSVLVMAYFDDLLVHKAPLPPLPFGIHCQSHPIPLRMTNCRALNLMSLGPHRLPLRMQWGTPSLWSPGMTRWLRRNERGLSPAPRHLPWYLRVK